MKKNFTLLSYILFALLLVFSSCSTDEEVSPENIALNNLSGTWTIDTGATPNGNVPLTGVSIDFNSENLIYIVSGMNFLLRENLTTTAIFSETGSFSLNSDQSSLILTYINNTSSYMVSGGDTTYFSVTINMPVDFEISNDTISLSYEIFYPESTSPTPITLTGIR